MGTYLQLKDRIKDELGGRADLTTQIVFAISSAILNYEEERFYFNETTSTFSTVANQEYYSSSDLADIPNMLRIDAMKILIGGNTYKLIHRDFDYIDRISTNTSLTGDPTDFCYYKQRIRLYPIPSAARTITVAYVKRLTALSADGDSNAWTGDAEELIRARAKWDLCWNVDHDEATAAMHKRVELEQIARLRAANIHRLSTGRIRATDF